MNAPRSSLRRALGLLFALLLMVGVVSAAERQGDPDGCLSCHALAGLRYVDDQGVLRVATIDREHYLGSLHGSVPCRDCHREIRYYPHDPENGRVDCAESCHIDEPSNGEAFTHRAIVDEFTESAHGQGWTQGLTGANRLEEERMDAPSCRRCHPNDAYIVEEQVERFKAALNHTEMECGNCHQGEAWRNQFGGHILRRLVGSRWKREDANRSCDDCHADPQRMARVELDDGEGGKVAAGYRWRHASDSYAKSLHARLLRIDGEGGASCLDCHAPAGERHGILAAREPAAATHPDRLGRTCAQAGCHEFAEGGASGGFLAADLHDTDQLPISALDHLAELEWRGSGWVWAAVAFGVVALPFGLGQLVRLARRSEEEPQPVVGGERFKAVVLGQKRRAKPKPKSGPKSEPKLDRGEG